jgi:hypothetical protein
MALHYAAQAKLKDLNADWDALCGLNDAFVKLYHDIPDDSQVPNAEGLVPSPFL